MSKCGKICEVWASGDRIGALRIAARFFDRSMDTKFSSEVWMHIIIQIFIASFVKTQIKSRPPHFNS